VNKKPIISHHVASAASGLRHVFVRDLELKALIGIYEHEKLKPQRVIVNIDLSVTEGEGPKDDDIGHVVSYEIVVKKVEAMVAEGHINLIETLCEKIAAACLRDKRVRAARVRVEKPDIIANARSVGVEIERVR
jgi:dihydroneopterin aldolase